MPLLGVTEYVTITIDDKRASEIAEGADVLSVYAAVDGNKVMLTGTLSSLTMLLHSFGWNAKQVSRKVFDEKQNDI